MCATIPLSPHQKKKKKKKPRAPSFPTLQNNEVLPRRAVLNYQLLLFMLYHATSKSNPFCSRRHQHLRMERSLLQSIWSITPALLDLFQRLPLLSVPCNLTKLGPLLCSVTLLWLSNKVINYKVIISLLWRSNTVSAQLWSYTHRCAVHAVHVRKGQRVAV